MDEVIVLSGQFLSLYRIRGEVKYSTFYKLLNTNILLKSLVWLVDISLFIISLVFFNLMVLLVVVEEMLKC